MPYASTACPHCGKELSSVEKLPWHLSRECPKATQSGGTGKLVATSVPQPKQS